MKEKNLSTKKTIGDGEKVLNVTFSRVFLTFYKIHNQETEGKKYFQ